VSFAFLDCLTLSICCFFSHVEDIAGDEPEDAPLIPGLGVPGLLLLYGWIVFVFPQAEMTYQRHDTRVDDTGWIVDLLLMISILGHGFIYSGFNLVNLFYGLMNSHGNQLFILRLLIRLLKCCGNNM
jgi:hypothetical protein